MGYYGPQTGLLIEHGFLPKLEERGLIDRLNRVLFQFLDIHHIDSQGQQDH